MWRLTPASPAASSESSSFHPSTATKKEAATVAATDVRPKITLACEECKHRNYITRKNRRNDPDRLEIKKFCPNCGVHRKHKETR